MMRTGLNFLSVSLAALGSFFLILPFFAAGDCAYEAFAPAGASIFFPMESTTWIQLWCGIGVTALHVLGLSFLFLWVRDPWDGWKSYLLRWLQLFFALMVSVGVFLGIGLIYRHAVVPEQKEFYARDLPVLGIGLFVMLMSFGLAYRFSAFSKSNATEVARKTTSAENPTSGFP